MYGFGYGLCYKAGFSTGGFDVVLFQQTAGAACGNDFPSHFLQCLHEWNEVGFVTYTD